MRFSSCFFLFLSFFFLIYSVNAQEYTLVVRKKEKESDFYPHIGGVMHGDISIETICSHPISTKSNLEIVSFNITYGYKNAGEPIKITGNTIPQFLCEKWKAIDHEGLPVFFTEIIARDKNQVSHKLLNFHLTLK